MPTFSYSFTIINIINFLILKYYLYVKCIYIHKIKLNRNN